MMLQRAASNAYSWWWAGHIRTKQSKWLEQSLQDMEEKVHYVLSLIQEDGDTFAKRAEMYYKKRPELISFVEESYRAFRALAERYDHLSTELQNSNNTLATCFPDQFQIPMDEDDEYGSTKISRMPSPISAPNAPNAPMVPKALANDLKGLVQKRSKELQNKSPSNGNDSEARAVAKSGLSKSEAIEEIDKLHKDILGLQTVKEYVKSSYQSGLEKYWTIENTIMEKQQKVYNLQDEFDIVKVIEDDEARRLMAEAALKSCQETLTELRETQQKTVREAKEEGEKIEDASQRLKHINDQYLHEQTDGEEDKPFSENNYTFNTGDVTPSSSIDLGGVTPEEINQQFDSSSITSISVTELAEKIDELVSKVINLESAVSSQIALIDRLRSESHELHEHIDTLEDDKETLSEGTNELRKKVKEVQEKLNAVRDLNRNVECSNTNLETRFAEAQSSLDRISEKLNNVTTDEELNTTLSKQDETRQQEESNTEPEEESNTQTQEESNTQEKVSQEHFPSDDKEASALSKTEDADAKLGHTLDENVDLNWPMLLLSGEEDKEKLLLKEYTIVLKAYKKLKRKLIAMEKKEKEEHVEQITELRIAITKRDEAIQYLRRKLIALQRTFTMNTDADESSTFCPSDDQNIEDTTIEEGVTSCTTEEDKYFNSILSDHNKTISPVEENIRKDVDTILDENLDFWLRFSTSFHQIEKFKTMVEDLQGEISQTRDKKQYEYKFSFGVKSELRPIYKHLKEIEIELKAWLKQTATLKEEVERRSSCICDIQEKISLALKQGIEEEEIIISSHQASKFQGEILYMKQENKKVSDELQSGIDHMISIQGEVDRTLIKLNDEFGNQHLNRSHIRSKIPLRSFLFGVRRKKQKSIFAFMHPTRKYQVLRAGVPM
ncbi:hypothetical protein Leryth_006868 [Lithospermum erythrorhizon]|nr:hypothetical protein Leryth_006868 [Lithospermum erythrorhizon]